MLRSTLLGWEGKGHPLCVTDEVIDSQHPYYQGEKGAGLGSQVPRLLSPLHMCGFPSFLLFS